MQQSWFQAIVHEFDSVQKYPGTIPRHQVKNNDKKKFCNMLITMASISSIRNQRAYSLVAESTLCLTSIEGQGDAVYVS